MEKHFSKSDLLVIIITFLLFTIALFSKGFTKDLFLEIGILLVSIKIIMMNHKNLSKNENIMKELEEIKKNISDMKDRDK